VRDSHQKIDYDYRFGFNGAEKDNEVKGIGNSLDLGARIYDSRLGKMLSRDPSELEYPWQSTYAYYKNSPIGQIDFNGEGDYYGKSGKHLGSDGKNDNLAYSATGKSEILKNGQGTGKFKFENAKKLSMTNSEFLNSAYLVYHESSLAGNKNTALWIAHTVNNALKSSDGSLNRGKSSFNALFKTGYSSAPNSEKNKSLTTSNSNLSGVNARAAVLDVLSGGIDPTGGAVLWDGMDLISNYGGKESVLQHPKFKQYGAVAMHKDHIGEMISFWSKYENKRKINKNAIILSNEFSIQGALQRNRYGVFRNFNGGFIGVNKNSTKMKTYLESTGFHGGTIFWKKKTTK